jgi:EpsI family protein
MASLLINEGGKMKTISSSKRIAGIPMKLNDFIGEDAYPAHEDSYDSSADEWIVRNYTDIKNRKTSIQVFVGYWENQDETKKIKPPRYKTDRWQHYGIESEFITLDSGTAKLIAFFSEKGSQRELVYYGYIVNGNIVSNEYVFRFLNVINAVLHGRNNAALFRVSVPVAEGSEIKNVEEHTMEFLQSILPLILDFT